MRFDQRLTTANSKDRESVVDTASILATSITQLVIFGEQQPKLASLSKDYRMTCMQCVLGCSLVHFGSLLSTLTAHKLLVEPQKKRHMANSIFAKERESTMRRVEHIVSLARSPEHFHWTLPVSVSVCVCIALLLDSSTDYLQWLSEAERENCCSWHFTFALTLLTVTRRAVQLLFQLFSITTVKDYFDYKDMQCTVRLHREHSAIHWAITFVSKTKIKM